MFAGRYLDLLDLTRESARFASVRDPFTLIMPNDHFDCSDSAQFFFYYQTSCIFSPPSTDTTCGANNPFCNGLNPYVRLDPQTDDIVISVFTLDANNIVSDSHPKLIADPAHPTMWVANGSLKDPVTNNSLIGSGIDDGGELTYYWALSNNDADTAHNENWRKDCNGNYVNPSRNYPYYTKSRVMNITAPSNVQGTRISNGAPASKGFVAVEVYYCYRQTLGLPFFTFFVPNPMMIHAYTLMPLPAAAPTPTVHP